MKPKNEEVHDYVRVLQSAAANSTDNFLLIGEVLSLIFDGRLYKHYAEHITSFDGFLAEMGLKRANAYHALRVWRKFGGRPLEGIKHDRLIRLLPINMDDADKLRWLDDARELPAQGFNDAVREARGLPTTDKCTHKGTVTKRFCSCCGKILWTEKSP
jgi:hypothetical protein